MLGLWGGCAEGAGKVSPDIPTAREGWIPVPTAPPDFRRELVLGLKMARVSLRFAKEFAKATEPPRPGKGRKWVSEALLSLFDRTSPKLVLLKKVTIFQYLMILAALPSS